MILIVVERKIFRVLSINFMVFLTLINIGTEECAVDIVASLILKSSSCGVKPLAWIKQKKFSQVIQFLDSLLCQICDFFVILFTHDHHNKLQIFRRNILFRNV